MNIVHAFNVRPSPSVCTQVSLFLHYPLGPPEPKATSAPTWWRFPRPLRLPVAFAALLSVHSQTSAFHLKSSSQRLHLQALSTPCHHRTVKCLSRAQCFGLLSPAPILFSDTVYGQEPSARGLSPPSSRQSESTCTSTFTLSSSSSFYFHTNLFAPTKYMATLLILAVPLTVGLDIP